MNHISGHTQGPTSEFHRVLSKCKASLSLRLPQSCRSRHEPLASVPPCDPLSRNHDTATVRVNLPEESINFVSQGTYGIVDLGASMSVIGQSQFEDLCKVLPIAVTCTMKEAPCAINFRFGTDSSVLGKPSVFFPVG